MGRNKAQGKYRRFDEFLLNHIVVRSNYGSCVYILKRNEKVILHLLLNIDEFLIANSKKIDIRKLKKILNSEFGMEDLGEAKRIVDMYIMRSRKKNELFLSQFIYLKKSVEAI